MAEQTRKRSAQQLRAAFCAVLGLVTCVIGAALLVPTVTKRSMVKLLSRSFLQKDQGLLLQREAFAMGNVLPVYGSSELVKPVKNRVGDFFKDAPTGFRVCAVGKAGNKCLLMAEKFAALGNSLRGRSVVLLVSSTWFGSQSPPVEIGQRQPVESYDGNFSALHGMNLVLDDSLNADVRRRLSGRMLDFPGPLETQPLLMASLREIVNAKPEGFMQTAKQGAMRALLRLTKWIYDFEDQLNTAVMALSLGADDLPGSSRPVALDWDQLLKSNVTSDHAGTTGAVAARKESAYLKRISVSPEWSDLALLLDLLKSLGARVLVVNIPFPSRVAYVGPLTKKTHDYYHERLAAVCAARGVALALFADHAGDPDFLIGDTTHFTEAGWLPVNKCIDDFYHGRLPQPAKRALHE